LEVDKADRKVRDVGDTVFGGGIATPTATIPTEFDGVDGTEDSGEVGDDFNDNSSAAINARARLTEAEEADLEADTIRQLIRDALWARWQARG
jgi:hypothetical protein